MKKNVKRDEHPSMRVFFKKSANECKFLLTVFFLFASVNLYAQWPEYDLSEVEDCRVVVLKCKLDFIDKKEVKENNDYTIKVVTKQGGAGWLQIFVRDKNGKSVTNYQSPKKNCRCEKKVTDYKYDNECYVFYGKVKKYIALSYMSTKGSVLKSEHVIQLSKSETGDFSHVYSYTVLACDFYRDKDKKWCVLESEPYIEQYLPGVYEYKDNLLYAFFKDKYYYYK